MQQISFPYVRDLAVKFFSFYDCTFTVSITLSLKSRPGTIHLLNYYQPLDIICLPYDDTNNLYFIWY